MNWYRIKTVLTFLFLGINIFLATLLCAAQPKTMRQEKARIESAVEVLSKSGIRVSCTVPYQTEKLRVLTLENPKASPEALAEKILGGKVTRLGDSYRREGRVVTLSEKGFLYDSGLESIPAEKKNISQMKNALSELGFTMTYAKGSLMEDAVIFTQTIDGVSLFGCQLTVYPTPDGQIAKLEGKWAEITHAEGERQKTQSAADALLSYLQAGITEEIVRVECGYAVLSKESGYRTADAVPVWLIETIGKNVHFFDAR